MSHKPIKHSLWLSGIAAVAMLVCCQQAQQQKQPCVKVKSLALKYRPHFTVDYYDGFKVISVLSKDSAKISEQYVLLPKGKPAPIGFENATLIETPVRGSISVSTNHIAMYRQLGLADTLLAVANADLIYDSLVQKNIRSGHTKSVGSNEYNVELMAALNPSFVLHFGSYDGGDKLQTQLRSLNVKTVLCPDYIEQIPLARAEWIKFLAAFYDLEDKADSLFNITESSYLGLKKKVVGVINKPTVFFNMPFKEIWYMPTSENFTTLLTADAGGEFLWKDAQPNNGLNLSLDYEAVYAKAANADFWLVNSAANTLRDIESADAKNKLFKAFKNGNVYNHNKRITPSGGSDYWESGVINPHILLADMIKIFHPHLLPEHELYYYKKLK